MTYDFDSKLEENQTPIINKNFIISNDFILNGTNDKYSNEQKMILNRKARRLHKILIKNAFFVRVTKENPMCEQGSSSTFVYEDIDNKADIKPLDQILKKSENTPIDPKLITPQKSPKVSQRRPIIIVDKLSPSENKIKPKRMESEKPVKKRSTKLRKVSIIKNSSSLRVNQSKEKPSDSKKSKFSETENDLSSNRDYSEEQGHVFNIISINGKSNTNLSRSEYKHCSPTKSTLCSMRASNRKTAYKHNFYKKNFNTSTNS
jgi:hypothetical protein